MSYERRIAAARLSDSLLDQLLDLDDYESKSKRRSQPTSRRSPAPRPARDSPANLIPPEGQSGSRAALRTKVPPHRQQPVSRRPFTTITLGTRVVGRARHLLSFLKASQESAWLWFIFF